MLPALKLRGLPFSATEADVRNFFHGFECLDVLIVMKEGRPAGVAFVLLGSSTLAEMAMGQLNKSNMGRRYIDIFSASRDEYYAAVAEHVTGLGASQPTGIEKELWVPIGGEPLRTVMDSSSTLAPAISEPPTTSTIKMRGLPWTATEQDICKFFAGLPLDPQNVLLLKRDDGRAKGEATVNFGTIELAAAAMSFDRRTIGNRYIELFPC